MNIMHIGLINQVAFISGVAKPNGIGFATAKALAEEGVKICITDISPMVHERGEELKNIGADVTSYVTDLRQLSSVKETAVKVIERYGKVDILCNVAGMVITGGDDEKLVTILDMNEKDWDSYATGRLLFFAVSPVACPEVRAVFYRPRSRTL